ncbi:MAG TPA: hypothetical protein PLO35_06200, partial [Candidatus Cloacimonadota bacterium]|nr:hypothetical protein [Candidatus Cloacimonadota bacterium]
MNIRNAMPLRLARRSSIGHDKGIHDNEIAGRLDFNQHTCGQNASDVLLEVQSPLKQGDKRLFCPGALNFVELTNPLPAMKT